MFVSPFPNKHACSENASPFKLSVLILDLDNSLHGLSEEILYLSNVKGWKTTLWHIVCFTVAPVSSDYFESHSIAIIVKCIVLFCEKNKYFNSPLKEY